MAHVPLAVTSVNVIVTVPHASVAVGAVNDGVAGQSIVALAPAALIVGGVISLTVIVCAAVTVLPQPSAAVHVLVTE